jgi:TRAP-type C4-dicarboxylate transport system permease small subunit
MGSRSLSMELDDAAIEAPPAGHPLRALVGGFYRLLLVLACISMVMTLLTILLGIAGREAGWDIPGLDAYAGYSIAAALFLALPATLQHGDHIRVTLLMGKLPERGRNALEYWALGSALALSVYVAVFACRLVWVSYLTHDISTGADAMPLWIPQTLMALGCIGFAVAFADALLARLQGRTFFEETGDDIARVE